MSLLWDFFNRHIVVFFETSVLKEVRILRYLHNNSVVLILMLSSKKSYPILYLYILEKLSYVADFFYDNVFYTLYFFNCSTLFFIKLFFFFWKTQNISESMFLHNIVELYWISFLFIKDLYKRWVFYIKWEQNYISKLHSMMTHILMSWFKESTERRKTSFSKEPVEKSRPT